METDQWHVKEGCSIPFFGWYIKKDQCRHQTYLIESDIPSFIILFMMSISPSAPKFELGLCCFQISDYQWQTKWCSAGIMTFLCNQKQKVILRKDLVSITQNDLLPQEACLGSMCNKLLGLYSLAAAAEQGMWFGNKEMVLRASFKAHLTLLQKGPSI